MICRVTCENDTANFTLGNQFACPADKNKIQKFEYNVEPTDAVKNAPGIVH